MGTNEVEPILEEALSAFPDGATFHLFELVVDSMKPDSTIQSQAWKKLESFNESGEIEVEKGKWLWWSNAGEMEEARLTIARAYHNMGAELQKREELEGATLAYRRSLEFSPRMKTYEALANVLVSAGSGEEAARVVFEAVERYPQASSGLHIAASNALLASGRLNEAIAMCHKALGKEPMPMQVQAVFDFYRQFLDGDFQGVSRAAYTWMGLDLWREGKVDEAIRAYRKAVEVDGANSGARFNLGLACLALGRVEEAERAYAAGMERSGGAERADAAEALRGLISRGIQVEAARKILETYWPR